MPQTQCALRRQRGTSKDGCRVLGVPFQVAAARRETRQAWRFDALLALKLFGQLGALCRSQNVFKPMKEKGRPKAWPCHDALHWTLWVTANSGWVSLPTPLGGPRVWCGSAPHEALRTRRVHSSWCHILRCRKRESGRRHNLQGGPRRGSSPLVVTPRQECKERETKEWTRGDPLGVPRALAQASKSLLNNPASLPTQNA
jgi:hypothetical protein